MRSTASSIEVPGTSATVAAIIYAAKSSPDEKDSIGTQIAQARAAAEAEGREVVAVYSEQDVSAYSGARGDQLRLAFEHVERLAAEHGHAELWVQHADRLARGDARKAPHLIEYAVKARQHGYRLRAVQGDDLDDLVRAVLLGERNWEDSARKSEATKAGLRRAAERGEWRGGIVPDGFALVREVDDRGKVSRTVIKDPERAHIYELVWELALGGASVQGIQLELSRRGYVTAAVRRDHKSRAFDSARIRKTLDNPFYAGVVVHRGETLPVNGNWPRYVEPEDFYRLRAERAERGHVTRRGPGRPAAYMLARLATCGECGQPMHATGSRYTRGDGTRARYYVCAAHRYTHADAPEHCAAMPFDAVEVDRLVLSGIESLVTDAAALRDQLSAGRGIERERLHNQATAARDDMVRAERALKLADKHYTQALADDDEGRAGDVLRGISLLRTDLSQAEARLNASLDAVASLADEHGEAEDVLARIWHALSGRVRDAGDDIRRLNVVLAEWFATFAISRDDDGLLRVQPMLSDAAVARVMTRPWDWPHGVSVTCNGHPAQIIGRDLFGDLVLVTEGTEAEIVELQRKIAAGEDDASIIASVGEPPPLTPDANPQPPR